MAIVKDGASLSLILCDQCSGQIEPLLMEGKDAEGWRFLQGTYKCDRCGIYTIAGLRMQQLPN